MLLQGYSVEFRKILCDVTKVNLQYLLQDVCPQVLYWEVYSYVDDNFTKTTWTALTFMRLRDVIYFRGTVALNNDPTLNSTLAVQSLTKDLRTPFED